MILPEVSMFTNVFLQNTQIGSVTNVDGFFTISKVPIGSYNMLITYIGYDTLIVPVIVNENEIHTGKYYITPSLSQLKEVEITAEREEMKTEVIELLETFQLPYIIAPFEAEAQCAVLEEVNLILCFLFYDEISIFVL